MVTCSICKSLYFHSCVDLSTSEVRAIKSKKGLKWTCQNCANIGDGLNDLKAIVLALQKEIESLKSIKVDPPNNNCNLDYEEIIQEINERNVRKRNVVVFGLPENSNLSSADRKVRDLNAVTNVLRYLSPTYDTSNINQFRLGKFDATKTSARPIKIILNDEQLVHELIRNAKQLQNHDTLSGVRISLDRTPRQLEYYRSLKNEMNMRTANGESNLQIKHVRGIPKIISLN